MLMTNLATIESTNFINKTIEKEKKHISGDGDTRHSIVLRYLIFYYSFL